MRYLPNVGVPVALALSLSAFGLAGCGGKLGKASVQGKPMVTELAVKSSDRVANAVLANPGTDSALLRADQLQSAANGTPASAAVEGQVTFRKDRILDRAFLYGFDLQYSSGADTSFDLIPQAEALGHIPATFRIVSGQLQLVADQTRLFESDINHPELLLVTYKVISEDETTVTVQADRSGIVINELFNGKGSPALKETWVRSLKFVEEGEYLLQETGLLLQDGVVQTYLESVFPRDSLVPSDYQPIENNPDQNPLAERYRLLPGEKVFVGRTGANGIAFREQTTFATRYNLGEKGTIDWYVTANIPDKFLPVVKSGVEGWNRYFRPQLGRDVMRFLGRLPADVRLGDPRYNVVNWDSVADAGAAYESQASDPLTGIQSHSIIYLPLAWYNIGTQLWQKRVDPLATLSAHDLSAKLSPKSPEVAFNKDHRVLSCVRTAEDIAASSEALLTWVKSGDQSAPQTLDDFAMRLVTSTLFHEVGHALGFDHNFKGSLSFDGSKPASEANSTTSSIMDYNYYQAEQKLFGELGTSDGQQLEYDRQVISQLYNKGKDVSATDAVLPACNDAEADNTAGGADPLCVRYDAENDPSISVQHSYDNVVQTTGAHGLEALTLAESIASVSDSATAKFSDPANATDVAALKALGTSFGKQVGELANYFVSAGAQSLRVNVRNNGKALRLWAADIPVDEGAFRGRVSAALNDAMSWRALPAVPAAALMNLEQVVADAVAKNPSAGATAEERGVTAQVVKAAFAAAIDAKVALALSTMRQGIYTVLNYDPASPFALRLTPHGTVSHFEKEATSLLQAGVLIGLTGDDDAIPGLSAERAAAAGLLVSFRDIDPVLDATVAQLNELQAKAQDDAAQNLVDETRALIKVLK